MASIETMKFRPPIYEAPNKVPTQGEIDTFSPLKAAEVAVANTGPGQDYAPYGKMTETKDKPVVVQQKNGGNSFQLGTASEWQAEA